MSPAGRGGSVRGMLWRLFTTGVLVAGLLSAAGPAAAETNPACPSGVTKIGRTGYITIGGATFASVKQFKGCGKNYGYLYVWQSWRDSHADWDICVSIVDAERVPIGVVCAADTRRAELWSQGTDTLTECTSALGWYGTRTNLIWGGRTDTVC